MLRAEIHRDGKMYEQVFERGKPVSDVKVLGNTEKRGTIITFKPDDTIFAVTEYRY